VRFRETGHVKQVSNKGTGKGIPLQTGREPDDSWRLMFPDFKTIGK